MGTRPLSWWGYRATFHALVTERGVGVTRAGSPLSDSVVA